MQPHDKPDFLIIGAAKAATTSLAAMLANHPEAGIAANKEPHFFSMDQQYQKGWDWYQTCFRHCTHKQIVGDASTSYSRIRHHPNTLSRIVQHVPNVKIIYMVRHPLRRIVSAYIERLISIDNYNRYPTVNHAVRAEPMLIDSSRYWEVFSHYRDWIPESRIHIVWFEDFIRNTSSEFRDVCRFLDIDKDINIKSDRNYRNSSKEKLEVILRQAEAYGVRISTEWDDQTRQWVLDQLREDSLQLLSHFRKPRDYWHDIS